MLFVLAMASLEPASTRLSAAEAAILARAVILRAEQKARATAAAERAVQSACTPLGSAAAEAADYVRPAWPTFARGRDDTEAVLRMAKLQEARDRNEASRSYYLRRAFERTPVLPPEEVARRAAALMSDAPDAAAASPSPSASAAAPVVGAPPPPK